MNGDRPELTKRDESEGFSTQVIRAASDFERALATARTAAAAPAGA